uniref:Ecdysteroid UDP-glucosyltransferase n=1 Tax=Sipha flava TaxID=143950 RepID=A0A2S2QH05_9HEMI
MYYQILTVMLLALGNHVQPTDGANILAFFPLPIYSHFSGFNPLFLELADRGHRVTVVSPFQPKGTVPSTYKHVSITNVRIPRRTNLLDIPKSYRITNMINVRKTMMEMVRRTLVLKDTQAFLNDTRNAFDLVLSECWYSDAFLAVGHRYSAPVMCLSPMMPSATLCAALGSPNNPSFVPSFWLHYSDAMRFSERLFNAVITAAEMLLSGVVYRDVDQEMADALFTYPGHEHRPPMDELRGAVAVTLINSHHSVSYPRPYPPGFVSVAGMHMRPKKESAVKVEPGPRKI